MTGGSVAVGAVVGLGLACASVGVGDRGAGVTDPDADGDELGDDDGEGDGLADGAATCCEAITAAPSRSSATRATAAKTVNTVDQRSAVRLAGGGLGGGGATLVPAGGRSSCAVASGSAGGFSCTRHETARAMPNGRQVGR